MDSSVISGIILGLILLLLGIYTSGGTAGAFWDVASVLIVLGGTLAAVMIRYGYSSIPRIVQLYRVAMRKKTTHPEETIRTIVRLSEIARRDGLLAMEDETGEMDDPFLKQGVQLVVDGTDPELVKSVLEIEMAFLEDRHSEGQGIFSFMASVSPAFGMMGTLIGLIIMLGGLDDPDSIGPGMAMALITTMYGTVLANLFFSPIAGRLRLLTEEEIFHKEIITEGILSIQQGENPRVIEHKLKAFLSPTQRVTDMRQVPGRAAQSSEVESVVS